MLFADIKGFTSMAQKLRPGKVLHLLNRLYSGLDALLQPCGVYKVETIGDCYVAAAGLQLESDGLYPGDVTRAEESTRNAVRILSFAQQLL